MKAVLVARASRQVVIQHGVRGRIRRAPSSPNPARGEPAGRGLDLLLHRAEVQVLPVDSEQIEIARSAWRDAPRSANVVLIGCGYHA